MCKGSVSTCTTNGNGNTEWCYITEDSTCPDAHPGANNQKWSVAACAHQQRTSFTLNTHSLWRENTNKTFVWTAHALPWTLQFVNGMQQFRMAYGPFEDCDANGRQHNYLRWIAMTIASGVSE